MNQTTTVEAFWVDDHRPMTLTMQFQGGGDWALARMRDHLRATYGDSSNEAGTVADRATMTHWSGE